MNKYIKIVKKKLYFLLVEKNSLIKESYWRYKNGTIKNHRFHKLLSYCFLLKQNLSLFFKRSINVGLLPFPESKISLQDIEEIIHKLKSYEVVSFDLFDTLLFYKLGNQYDSFRQIGENSLILNFAHRRFEAETKLNKAGKFASINDLYDILTAEGTIQSAQEGIKREKDFLLDGFIPNPFIQKIYDAALELGKKIILVCETCYPSDFLRELLAHYGYSKIEDIIVSCEQLASKKDGRLYDIVKNKFGSVIHFGSHYDFDYLKALEAGMMAQYYHAPSVAGSHYRVIYNSSLSSAMYRAAVNSKLHNGLTNKFDTFYELGYSYGGLLCYGFCQWLNKLAKQEGIDKYLFTSRDTYLFVEVYKKYFGAIKSEYIFCSRSAIRRADFPGELDLYFETFFNLRIDKYTIKDCFVNAGLDLLLDELYTIKIDQNALLTADKTERIYQFIIDHKNEVMSIYQPERQAVNHYIYDVSANCKKVCIVDLGWRGTSTAFFKKVLNESGIEVVGAVIGAINDTIPNALIENNCLFSYVFSSYQNADLILDRHGVMCFETLFSSNTPGLISFRIENKDKNTSFKFNSKYRGANTFQKEFRDGMFAFCEDYNNHIKILGNSTLSGRDAFLPLANILREGYYRNILEVSYNTDIPGGEEMLLKKLLE